jgi:hypothetical protein
MNESGNQSSLSLSSPLPTCKNPNTLEELPMSVKRHLKDDRIGASMPRLSIKTNKHTRKTHFGGRDDLNFPRVPPWTFAFG